MERELRLFQEFRNHLIEDLGEKKGAEVFANFIGNRTERGWRETVEACVDDVSLKSFVDFFWGPLKQSLKYEESWDGDNKVQFKVTHCTVCEACKKAGLTDIGYHVYCMTDPAVIKGINPESYMQLMEAAYPEFMDALRSKERTMILNINLSEKGKPPL